MAATAWDRLVAWGTSGPSEPGARFLDQFLTIRAGTPSAALVHEIEDRLRQARSQETRHDAAERMRKVLDNIIANLTLLVLSPDYEPGDTLAVSTAKTATTRYDRPLGKHLWAKLIGELVQAEDIVRHQAQFKQLVTTIEPTETLRGRLQNLNLADLARDASAESIWLSARTGTSGWHGQPAPKELLEYSDDADSRKFRRGMARINKFLNATPLTFHGRSQGPVALRRHFLLRHRTDQVFFELNGRLAGGFWMSLRAQERGAIRLAGEPLADLDFKAMFIQLAYRSQGDELSEDFDPYKIPGLENHRDGAKLAMLSLLGRSTRMAKLSPELRDALPPGWNAARLMAAVKELHYGIEDLFSKDLAVQWMFHESQILIAVLLRLIDEGVPALPMHDGIMVPVSKKAAAQLAMQEVSANWLGGAPLPVSEKPVNILN